MSTPRAILEALRWFRRRGSTTAAIAGANAQGGTLVVHDAHFMALAKRMGAQRVQTLVALPYGNPAEGPIVLDHHAAVVLASAYEDEADMWRGRAVRAEADVERQRSAHRRDVERAERRERRMLDCIDDLRAELGAAYRWSDDGGR